MLSTPKVPISFEAQQQSVAQQAQDCSVQHGSLLQSHLQDWVFMASPRVGCFQLNRRVLEGCLQHTLD